MHYKVKEVADMVGISVRMLHHYDKIGLLKPGRVSPAGYRLYTEKELERLQQVLFFKELDFGLQEIKTILDRPDFDRKKALKAHKQLLLEKQKRLEKIIRTVERTINSIEGGMDMDKKEMFKAFDLTELEEHKAKYAEETKRKYGNTEAYKESQQKTSEYTAKDWAAIQAKREKIYKKMMDAMDRGPADAVVQEAVEAWRQHITEYFYECTPETLRGLGDLYVSDERFTANIDKYKPGLAKFLRDAIHIYCDKLVK